MNKLKPLWRVGHKVPRNLYRGDEPIAMLATAEIAAEMVRLLNGHEDLLNACLEARAWLRTLSFAPIDASAERHRSHEVDAELSRVIAKAEGREKENAS